MLYERELGLSESYSCFCHDEAGGTTNLVGYISVSGDLNQEKIQNSLQNMLKRHHNLRSTFNKNDKKHRIKILPNLQNLPLTYREEDNPQWQNIIEEQQKKLFGDKQPNWRLEVINDNDTHHLFICFHHAISDGKSVSVFLSELINGCESSGVTAAEDRPLLPPLESLLQRKISWPAFLITMMASSRKYLLLRKHIQRYEQHSPIDQRTARNKYLVINPNILSKLIQESRHQGTTLTAALTAALLKSIEELNLGSKGKTKKHLLFTNIDVRDKCSPPIPQDQLGCFVDLAETQETIKPTDSNWDIARNYRKNLVKSIKKPGKLPYKFNQPLFHKMLRSFDQGFLQHRFQYGAGVTNIGKIDHFNKLQQLKINSFHFATSRRWGDWMVLLHVATINNKAYLSFSYSEPLLSNQSADKLVTAFSENLNAMLGKSAA